MIILVQFFEFVRNVQQQHEQLRHQHAAADCRLAAACRLVDVFTDRLRFLVLPAGFVHGSNRPAGAAERCDGEHPSRVPDRG